MSEGWIQLHRQICEHFLWDEKPFSPAQAWIDILLMANHKDGESYFKGHVVSIKRGERIVSFRKLSERWGWGMKKVRNFLNVLEHQKMVSLTTTATHTVLRIINYDIYQSKKELRGTVKGKEGERAGNAGGTPGAPNNNEIREKWNNENKKEGVPGFIKELMPEIEFVSLTKERYEKLCQDIGEAKTKQLMIELDDYIGRIGIGQANKKNKSHYHTIRAWSRRNGKMASGHGAAVRATQEGSTTAIGRTITN